MGSPSHCRTATVTLSVALLVFAGCASAPPAGSSNARGWTSESVTSGVDGELCTALFARINRFAAGPNKACVYDAIESYPKFSSPPWQRLDPKEHFGLIVKLKRYSQEGRTAYFDSDSPNRQPDSVYRRDAERFIKDGGEMFAWRTRLLSYFAAGRTAPSGPQTVVQLTSKLGTEHPNTECPGKTSKGWLRQTYIVLPDLSGPDPAVSEGKGGVLSSRWPVLYRGEPLLINWHSVRRPDYSICMFNSP